MHPQSPWDPTGPAPWFPDAFPLRGACHAALPFLTEQPVKPAPALHLLRRDGNAKRLPGRLAPALPQKPARAPRDHKRALDRVSDVHFSEVARPLGTSHFFPARFFSSALDQLVPRVLGGLEGRPERVEAPPPLEKLAAGEHLLDRLGEKVGLPRQLFFSPRRRRSSARSSARRSVSAAALSTFGRWISGRPVSPGAWRSSVRSRLAVLFGPVCLGSLVFSPPKK